MAREKRVCKADGCTNQLDKRNVSGLCYKHFERGEGRITVLRDYSSRDNIRRQIKEKLVASGKVCEKCGESRKEFLQLDHIIPVGLGGSDEIENLRILCGKCHENRHKIERFVSTGNAGLDESEKEKVRLRVALEGAEGSREMVISPTLWTSWNGWMKMEIIRYGFVTKHDAIHESARYLKEKWGQGSSVTTRRYLAEAIGDGKNGDYVTAWNPNLGNIIKFSERYQKRVIQETKID